MSGGRMIPMHTSSSSPAFQKRCVAGRKGDRLSRAGALLRLTFPLVAERPALDREALFLDVVDVHRWPGALRHRVVPLEILAALVPAPGDEGQSLAAAVIDRVRIRATPRLGLAGGHRACPAAGARSWPRSARCTPVVPRLSRRDMRAPAITAQIARPAEPTKSGDSSEFSLIAIAGPASAKARPPSTASAVAIRPPSSARLRAPASASAASESPTAGVEMAWRVVWRSARGVASPRRMAPASDAARRWGHRLHGGEARRGGGHPADQAQTWSPSGPQRTHQHSDR